MAAEVAALIRQRLGVHCPVVLGLATGSTPVAFYAELVRMHREEGLSFVKQLVTQVGERVNALLSGRGRVARLQGSGQLG